MISWVGFGLTGVMDDVVYDGMHEGKEIDSKRGVDGGRDFERED